MSFRGTNILQDNRFSDKQISDIQKISLPEIFNHKLNLDKVEMQIIKHWINDELKSMLTVEDSHFSEYIYNILLTDYKLPKKIYSILIQFLGEKTLSFMTNLWCVLIDSENSLNGVSFKIIERKRFELENLVTKEKKNLAFINNLYKNHVDSMNPMKEYSKHGRHYNNDNLFS